MDLPVEEEVQAPKPILQEVMLEQILAVVVVVDPITMQITKVVMVVLESYLFGIIWKHFSRI